MKFDKRISKLLSKALLVPVGISCLGFSCIFAMEENEDTDEDTDEDISDKLDVIVNSTLKSLKKDEIFKKIDEDVLEILIKAVIYSLINIILERESLNVGDMTISLLMTVDNYVKFPKVEFFEKIGKYLDKGLKDSKSEEKYMWDQAKTYFKPQYKLMFKNIARVFFYEVRDYEIAESEKERLERESNNFDSDPSKSCFIF